MAKAGDLVEFRSGLWATKPPRNIAIYMDRWRRKGQSFVRLMTLDGVKETKAENLTRKAFRARYEGPMQDEAGLKARLMQLASAHSQGEIQEEVDEDLGTIEQELWEAACDQSEPLSADELCAMMYGEEFSNPQRKQVLAALDRCRRAGTGRFETAGKGDVWRAWTRGEADQMRAAWEHLAVLQKKLITVQETEEGRVFQGVPIADVELDDDDKATLQWVQRAMVQFIEHDGVPSKDVAGLGGLGATQVFGMDLHRRLGFLAADWIRSEPTDRSSDYTNFLLETGLWKPHDAIASLTARHVNQEPFFEHVPDEAAESAANELPEPDIAADPGREDLRHLECYTIDPPDAKDFDDAVGIVPRGDGWTLWVHIADVSHYVRDGTLLDHHARKRATSVYLPGRVLPMLPHRIADHLCSLRSDGDRFALSAALQVDPDGRVSGATFHRAMIRVNENLSYDDALRGRDAGEPRWTQLFDLAQRMRRQRRGLALETGELRVILEDTGFDTSTKRGNDATRMIETFMVAANEAVAKHLDAEDVGALYRCHPLPEAAKAERFEHQAHTMGLDIELDLPTRKGTQEAATMSILDQLKSGGGKLQLFGGGMTMPKGEPEDDEEPEPEATPQGFAALSEEEQEGWLAPFRAAVDAIAELPSQARADVATIKLLGCMGRAWYGPGNEGHFGLGLSHYLHFTSPIRRYPDLVVHRNLKWIIDGRQGEAPHPHESLEAMADHCSDQERAAEGLERRVRAACLVLATSEGEGAARITGITPTSLWVRRDDGIEARVSTRDLPGGPYQIDEWESMLFLDPSHVEDAEGLKDWMDETRGALKVRAILGDTLGVRLVGRAVVDGKAYAYVTAWHGAKA